MTGHERTTAGIPVAITSILVVATLIRVPFLFWFGIDDDELYTLRNSEELLDSPTPAAVVSWPVLFAIMRVLTELFGLSEFALRLLPVCCGVAAPLVLFLLGRQIVGNRAAMFAALLVALWPWHQYFSGLARYYGPVFLLGIFLAHRLYLVLTRKRSSDRVVLIALLLLAAFTHATCLLGVAGGVVVLASPKVRGLDGRQRLILIGGAVALVVMVLLVPPFSGPVLRVLSGAGGHGYNAVQFVQSLVFNVTLSVLLLALLGTVSLLGRRRFEALFLVATAGLPVFVLTFLALREPTVQARYSMVAMPALLLLAGVGIERLVEPFRANGRLARSAVVGACVLPLLPGVFSNLIDGDRHDVRGMATFLEPRLEVGEILFAEAHATLGHHLFGLQRWMPPGYGEPPFPSYFGDSPPEPEQLNSMLRTRAAVRFVLPEKHFEMLPLLDRADYQDWLREHTRVETRLGRRRVDYHRNSLIVFQSTWGKKT